jgi:hypothetical protein
MIQELVCVKTVEHIAVVAVMVAYGRKELEILEAFQPNLIATLITIF